MEEAETENGKTDTAHGENNIYLFTIKRQKISSEFFYNYILIFFSILFLLIVPVLEDSISVCNASNLLFP